MFRLPFLVHHRFHLKQKISSGTTSQTLCQVGERNGASPNDLPKWETAQPYKTVLSAINRLK